MTVLNPHHVKIDGHVLATYANGLETLDGVEGVPARRIQTQPAAYIDGAYPLLDTPSFFDARRERLRVWVSPFDADGNTTHANGPEAHLRENLEALYAVVGGTAKSNHEVDWLVPTPTTTKTLRNWARIQAGIPSSGNTRLVRRLDILLEYPWPFFRDVTAGLITLGPFTGAQTFTPAGNAVLADLVLTCTAAGRITHDETGDWVEVDSIPSTSVVITQRPPRSILSGGADARAVFNSNRPQGALRFDAGVAANLTITGTWQIDYYNQEH